MKFNIVERSRYSKSQNPGELNKMEGVEARRARRPDEAVSEAKCRGGELNPYGFHH